MQILASGGGKSPAYRYLRTPVDRVEQAWAEDYRDALREWKVKRKRLETIVRKAKQAAEKVSAGDDAMLSLEDAERALMQHDDEKPVRKRIILDDATPQAAWNVIDKVQGAAAYISDEGGPLRLISRYSDDPIFDPWIKGFDGSPHPIDRKTGDEEKIIPRPILAVAIAAQPQPLEDMGQLRGFRELGVAARLLIAIPWPIVKHDLDAPAPDRDALAWWDATITRICLAEEGTAYAPATLKLDPDAEAAFRQERAWHQTRTDAGDFADMEEWGRKYPSHVLRVAGILHVLDHDEPGKRPIGAGTIARAVALMRPMIRHTWIAHSIMFGGYGRNAASEVLDAIRALEAQRDPAEPLTLRMIHRQLRGRVVYREVDSLRAPVAMLERCGWIRLDRQPVNGSRRPSDVIECNPALLSGVSGDMDNKPNSAPDDDDGPVIVPIVHASEPSPNNVLRLNRQDLAPTGTAGSPRTEPF